jgi:tetratricopeptide (TPR) repeat protein
MTDNHMLIIRLAELMLENEQHALPVDLLFDDAQIGDFVKSIQIDSPYQQLLLEGVLTESVREEKLYVSFTVEGYFHYVLGEVIFIQTEGKGPKALKQIFEDNALKAVREGIEQCLIRDVISGELSRLIWLIDSGGEFIEICSLPLAFAFLNLKGQLKTEEEFTQAIAIQANLVLDELFEEATDNDIKTLTKSINHLQNAQKNGVVSILYNQIIEQLVPDNLDKIQIYADSIMHLPESDRKKKLEYIIQIDIEEETIVTSSFYSSIAKQFDFIAEFDKALAYYEKSLAIDLKVHGDQHPSTSTSYNNLGVVWRDKGEYDKAIAYYEKSLAINLKIHGNQHPETGISYNDLGNVWSDKGEYDKAIEYLEKSLAIDLKVYGNQHPSTGTSYNSSGAVWNHKGEYDKAIAYYEKSLAIRIKVHGDQHPSTGISYNNLGNVWRNKGEYAKAVAYHEKSLAINLKVHGDQHPFTGTSYNNLGAVWRDKGEYDKAIEYYEKSLAIDLKIYGDQHPSTGKSYSGLGNVWRDKGELDMATAYYEKSYFIFLNSLGEDHPHTKLLQDKLASLNDR